MPGIIADVTAILKAHPEIDSNATLIVSFNQFGPSSRDFFIYIFTKTVEWVHYHEVKQDVLLKVADISRRTARKLPSLPARCTSNRPNLLQLNKQDRQ